MGWGIKLTEGQWDELDRLRFTAKSADVFRNCLIILMSDSSDTIGDIAEHLFHALGVRSRLLGRHLGLLIGCLCRVIVGRLRTC